MADVEGGDLTGIGERCGERWQERLSCWLHLRLGAGRQGDGMRIVGGAGARVARQSAYMRERAEAAAEADDGDDEFALPPVREYY